MTAPSLQPSPARARATITGFARSLSRSFSPISSANAEPTPFMNLQRQNWLISRRHFLRGAGVTLALPLLQCMVPIRAAAGAATPQAKRGVFIYLPNGVNTYDYQILEAGTDYKLSKPMASLEKH